MNAAEVDPQDQAIEAFEAALAAGASEVDATRSATAAFPQYAGLLADYALTVRAAREIEESEEISLLQAKVLARSQILIGRRFRPLSGISTAIAYQGQSVAEFCAAIGIARSLIFKLDRRLIAASSIPSAAIQRLADAISCTFDDLRAYLSGPPMLAHSTQHKSKTAPTIADEAGDVHQEAFDQAIDSAVAHREMTKEEAAQWKSR
jgi:hypothetical protein